ERLIQFASENLVTEILIHPQMNTLMQCMRNLLSSFTRHRHLVHAGYTFAGNGSWIMQDGTFSLADFTDAYQENEVQRVIRAYENSISIDVHCATGGGGDWARLPELPFVKHCKIRVNPTDILDSGSQAIKDFIAYLNPYIVPASLEQLLVSSDVVGNIRFSHPTLYVFPGGQGDAALFGINGFNMLVDGGFSRKACWWDFARHLDRLDAVLFTRLNNCSAAGMAAVLRRKATANVYPQIGHFFCNLEERASTSEADDKDADPLLVSLLAAGGGMARDLRRLGLRPQPCYRAPQPVNLYHKVGHGTLDMYVLNPSKDSKHVREFLKKWHDSEQKLFEGTNASGQFNFPIPNLVSICALLVWRPANPDDTITRIMFPGSTPQHKIFEGLEKLKHLEFLQHPTCTGREMLASAPPTTTTTTTTTTSTKASKHIISKVSKERSIISEKAKEDKIAEPEPSLMKDETDSKNQIDNKLLSELVGDEDTKIESVLNDAIAARVDTKLDDKLDSTIIGILPKKGDIKKKERNIEKRTKRIDKTDDLKDSVAKGTDTKKAESEVKTKTDIKKKQDKLKIETISRSKASHRTVQKSVDKKVVSSTTDKKSLIDKSPPTTPKKQLEPKLSASTVQTISKEKVKVKTRKLSPGSTPAKSAKEASNRRVVESKYKQSSPKREPSQKSADKKEQKKREPISRRPRPLASPVKGLKAIKSPSKSNKMAKVDTSKLKGIQRVNYEDILKDAKKSDEDTSKSLDDIKQQELDEREEQEIVREIEAVFNRDSEAEEKTDYVGRSDIEKITCMLDNVKTTTMVDGEYEEEYLIIEKEEVEQIIDEVGADREYRQEHDKDEQRKHQKDKEESEKNKQIDTDLNEMQQPMKSLESDQKNLDSKEHSISVEEKQDLSSEKKTSDSKSGVPKLKDSLELNIIQESQPDEKISTTIESGATTAPTLPEDERITLDGIKENQIIEEKHVEEVTKENLLPLTLISSQNITSKEKTPKIEPQTVPIREIVKTPDEVADLPLHEEVDYRLYEEKKTPVDDSLFKRKPDLGFVHEIKVPKDLPLTDQESILQSQAIEDDVILKTVQRASHAELITVTPGSAPESPIYHDKIKTINIPSKDLKPVKEFDNVDYSYGQYTEKLRETHITTVDSPIKEETRIIVEEQSCVPEKIPSIPEDIEREIEEAHKLELLHKAPCSPKDVEKIVADVAEVLKSDRSLEEIMAGKSPIEVHKSLDITGISTVDATKMLLASETSYEKDSATVQETKKGVSPARSNASDVSDLSEQTILSDGKRVKRGVSDKVDFDLISNQPQLIKEDKQTQQKVIELAQEHFDDKHIKIAVTEEKDTLDETDKNVLSEKKLSLTLDTAKTLEKLEEKMSDLRRKDDFASKSLPDELLEINPVVTTAIDTEETDKNVVTIDKTIKSFDEKSDKVLNKVLLKEFSTEDSKQTTLTEVKVIKDNITSVARDASLSPELIDETYKGDITLSNSIILKEAIPLSVKEGKIQLIDEKDSDEESAASNILKSDTKELSDIDVIPDIKDSISSKLDDLQVSVEKDIMLLTKDVDGERDGTVAGTIPVASLVPDTNKTHIISSPEVLEETMSASEKDSLSSTEEITEKETVTPKPTGLKKLSMDKYIPEDGFDLKQDKETIPSTSLDGFTEKGLIGFDEIGQPEETLTEKVETIYVKGLKITRNITIVTIRQTYFNTVESCKIIKILTKVLTQDKYPDGKIVSNTTEDVSFERDATEKHEERSKITETDDYLSFESKVEKEITKELKTLPDHHVTKDDSMQSPIKESTEFSLSPEEDAIEITTKDKEIKLIQESLDNKHILAKVEITKEEQDIKELSIVSNTQPQEPKKDVDAYIPLREEKLAEKIAPTPMLVDDITKKHEPDEKLLIADKPVKEDENLSIKEKPADDVSPINADEQETIEHVEVTKELASKSPPPTKQDKLSVHTLDIDTLPKEKSPSPVITKELHSDQGDKIETLKTQTVTEELPPVTRKDETVTEITRTDKEIKSIQESLDSKHISAKVEITQKEQDQKELSVVSDTQTKETKKDVDVHIPLHEGKLPKEIALTPTLVEDVSKKYELDGILSIADKPVTQEDENLSIKDKQADDASPIKADEQETIEHVEVTKELASKSPSPTKEDKIPAQPLDIDTLPKEKSPSPVIAKELHSDEGDKLEILETKTVKEELTPVKGMDETVTKITTTDKEIKSIQESLDSMHIPAKVEITHKEQDKTVLSIVSDTETKELKKDVDAHIPLREGKLAKDIEPTSKLVNDITKTYESDEKLLIADKPVTEEDKDLSVKEKLADDVSPIKADEQITIEHVEVTKELESKSPSPTKEEKLPLQPLDIGTLPKEKSPSPVIAKELRSDVGDKLEILETKTVKEELTPVKGMDETVTEITTTDKEIKSIQESLDSMHIPAKVEITQKEQDKTVLSIVSDTETKELKKDVDAHIPLREGKLAKDIAPTPKLVDDITKTYESDEKLLIADKPVTEEDKDLSVKEKLVDDVSPIKADEQITIEHVEVTKELESKSPSPTKEDKLPLQPLDIDTLPKEKSPSPVIAKELHSDEGDKTETLEMKAVKEELTLVVGKDETITEITTTDKEIKTILESLDSKHVSAKIELTQKEQDKTVLSIVSDIQTKEPKNDIDVHTPLREEKLATDIAPIPTLTEDITKIYELDEKLLIADKSVTQGDKDLSLKEKLADDVSPMKTVEQVTIEHVKATKDLASKSPSPTKEDKITAQPLDIDTLPKEKSPSPVIAKELHSDEGDKTETFETKTVKEELMQEKVTDETVTEITTTDKEIKTIQESLDSMHIPTKIEITPKEQDKRKLSVVSDTQSKEPKEDVDVHVPLREGKLAKDIALTPTSVDIITKKYESDEKLLIANKPATQEDENSSTKDKQADDVSHIKADEQETIEYVEVTKELAFKSPSPTKENKIPVQPLDIDTLPKEKSPSPVIAKELHSDEDDKTETLETQTVKEKLPLVKKKDETVTEITTTDKEIKSIQESLDSKHISAKVEITPKEQDKKELSVVSDTQTKETNKDVDVHIPLHEGKLAKDIAPTPILVDDVTIKYELEEKLLIADKPVTQENENLSIKHKQADDVIPIKADEQEIIEHVEVTKELASKSPSSTKEDKIPAQPLDIDTLPMEKSPSPTTAKELHSDEGYKTETIETKTLKEELTPVEGKDETLTEITTTDKEIKSIQESLDSKHIPARVEITPKEKDKRKLSVVSDTQSKEPKNDVDIHTPLREEKLSKDIASIPTLSQDIIEKYETDEKLLIGDKPVTQEDENLSLKEKLADDVGPMKADEQETIEHVEVTRELASKSPSPTKEDKIPVQPLDIDTLPKEKSPSPVIAKELHSDEGDKTETLEKKTFKEELTPVEGKHETVTVITTADKEIKSIQESLDSKRIPARVEITPKEQDKRKLSVVSDTQSKEPKEDVDVHDPLREGKLAKDIAPTPTLADDITKKYEANEKLLIGDKPVTQEHENLSLKEKLADDVGPMKADEQKTIEHVAVTKELASKSPSPTKEDKIPAQPLDIDTLPKEKSPSPVIAKELHSDE
ncbi:hypothetical protein ACJJTC_012314, partial [Scirpophaga incertulas]